MKSFCLFVALSVVFMSCTRVVYVVRHAEKMTASDSLSKALKDDPPLSDAGQVRALVLENELKKKKIKHIYSTHSNRAVLTAKPLSQATHLNIDYYSNVDSLVKLVLLVKGNVLVVGHSNTVDDIVNKLCKRTELMTDLGDTEYDNLFLIKIKHAKGVLTRRKYGYPSNPESVK